MQTLPKGLTKLHQMQSVHLQGLATNAALATKSIHVGCKVICDTVTA